MSNHEDDEFRVAFRGAEVRIRIEKEAPTTPVSPLELPVMAYVPYRFFSDLEERVLRLLVARGPMTCEEIARELDESPTGRLKAILGNLAQRKVLHSSNGGYRINFPEGEQEDAFKARLLGYLDNQHRDAGTTAQDR